jgi:hypothetical protein
MLRQPAANLLQVCFSGDGNYAATVAPANLERLFQAAVVEVAALRLSLHGCASSEAHSSSHFRLLLLVFT